MNYENKYLVINLKRIKTIKNNKNLIMKLDTEKENLIKVSVINIKMRKEGSTTIPQGSTLK